MGERRAPSAAKRGVPIELVRCPYEDERLGRPMNASALKQLTAQFGAVTKDVAAFHASLPADCTGWERMFRAVMDQLSRPAMLFLTSRDLQRPVPARAAAGHKLAAGYFGALQKLLVAEARGQALPPSAETFLEFVHDHRSLIGASEVCAGQPHNLRRMTRTFVSGRGTPQGTVDAVRVRVATNLCAQVRLGLAWQMFDRRQEHWLLQTLVQPDRARTDYLARRIAARHAELDAAPDPGDPRAVLPHAMADAVSAVLAEGGRGGADGAHVDVVSAAMDRGYSAVEFADQRDARAAAGWAADVITVYRAFVAAQCELEQDTRAALDYPTHAPVDLGPLLFPTPRSRRWVDIVTGHRLECTPSTSPALSLRGRGTSFALTGNEGSTYHGITA